MLNDTFNALFVDMKCYMKFENCNMLEPEPYFHDPVPPIDCVSDDDDFIIDVVGIHYFEQDNVGLRYRVNWKKNRNIGVWVPAKSMKTS